MIIIRSEQVQAFDRASLRRSEREMRRHLWQFNPKHCEAIGKPGVDTVIQRSMQKAFAYGFTNKGPVRLFLELVFIFGSDFDKDPLLPWVGNILNDQALPGQMLRSERLYSETLSFIDATAGEDFRYENEALKLVRSIRYDDLTLPGGDLKAGCLNRLQHIYPRKVDYVGVPALEQLIHDAGAQARNHSITTQQGLLLFIALMFFIGHGFATDPLYPWIEGTLTNNAISDPNLRAERLHAKTMTYIDHILARQT